MAASLCVWKWRAPARPASAATCSSGGRPRPSSNGGRASHDRSGHRLSPRHISRRDRACRTSRAQPLRASRRAARGDRDGSGESGRARSARGGTAAGGTAGRLRGQRTCRRRRSRCHGIEARARSQGLAVDRRSVCACRRWPQRSSARRAHCQCARGLRDRHRRGPMTVHFIGAGPGAADLITVRGRKLIGQCAVCLYAGSLVPRELLEYCPPGARVIDSAPMSLDEIIEKCRRATEQEHDVARLHSGDLSVWSALGEQLRRLDELGIPYTITPGVPSFSAAAAALGQELTLPEVAQSVVLTRTSGRASAMPPGETLEAFARTGATLAIHLSIQAIDRVVAELLPFYGADCPPPWSIRRGGPTSRVIRATLRDIAAEVAKHPIERTALILVGKVLDARDFRESALYDAAYQRRFRGRGV